MLFVLQCNYMEEEKDSNILRAVALAQLEKSEEEQIQFSAEIEKILTFVSEVQSVDTKNAETSIGTTNVFRDDAVTVEPEKYREQMLEQAPATFKKWFLSKKIL